MTQLKFNHHLLQQEVRFGTGDAAKNVKEAVEALGATRPFLIASEREEELAQKVTNGLELAAEFNDVVMHVPVEKAEEARKAAADAQADVLISIGGGSTTGLAKAVALTSGLPIIAVPTTYAGSEATAVWGMTENRTKTTGTDPQVLPKVVVYDSELLSTLPNDMTIASGLNAMAHCVDTLWAPKADPINRSHALEGARLLRDGLAELQETGSTQAREKTLAGCYLAALSFSSAGSGLHHKICHVLGGTFNLPHAETHAIVLPNVLRFNAAAGERAHVDRLAEVFGTDDAVTGLEALYDAIGAPRHLAAIGFREADIPEAVERIVAAAPKDNPVKVTAENITELLKNAL
ncbi:maleylacetate reductase [Corynebacterium deserti GIMN1.010]|uniref:Maleylacetate reductase n=1 Tax=Corynebacterium deserti GIMN1.010 TaxID=931089 RepID=A0A0M4CI95_9CORY|nr:maleylacetate reductase [Corynebacterium deserti]ALC05176.1 maleylacetate reductase [Corynebacterium deserti GIMN1.010]